MPIPKNSRKFAACFTLLFAFASIAVERAGAQMNDVYDFNGTNGSSPQAGVIFDSAGNLYSTTLEGGTDQDGVVFELSPQAGGGWSEEILHSFSTGGADGNNPRGSSLILDAQGNLYGTTTFGGSETVGVAFVLSKIGGVWKEKIVHTFGHLGGEGYYPEGTLVMDKSGNLYGVTNKGGAYGYGTVYEISVAANGTWTTQILYSFNASGNDGTTPLGTLIFDAAGNLYGTTQLGGFYGGGTVFELSERSGVWMEKVLYNFHERPAANQPYTGVVMDAAGNLYGTTYNGGVNEEGTVYRLAPLGGGWQETTLYSFARSEAGGYGPTTELAFDHAGNLYGTLEDGGVNFAGEIYELTPSAGGIWTESDFYSFTDSGGPVFPQSGLTLGPDGNFYGTTAGGGSSALGAVYSIAPL